jgi:hypothetical protein
VVAFLLSRNQNRSMQNGRNRIKRFVTGRTEQGSVRIPGKAVTYNLLGKNRVWFTRHAIERVKQRGIDQESVFAVLENPSLKGLPADPGKKRWRLDRRGKKSIDVVFRLEPQQVTIITTFKV